MFYDTKVMNSKTLGPAWKAAHNLLTKESTDTVCLPKICKALHDRINSQHRSKRKRFSLRTSSTFISGAARLYKQGLDDLYKDTRKLLNHIQKSKRRRVDEDIKETKDEGMSSPEETPDQMRKRQVGEIQESSKTTREQREQSRIPIESSSAAHSEESSKTTQEQTEQSRILVESSSASHLEEPSSTTEEQREQSWITIASSSSAHSKDVIKDQSTSKIASRSVKRSKRSIEETIVRPELTERTVDGKSKTRMESISRKRTEASMIRQSKIRSSEKSKTRKQSISMERTEASVNGQSKIRLAEAEKSETRTEPISIEHTEASVDEQSKIQLTEGEPSRVESQNSADKISLNLETSEGPRQSRAEPAEKKDIGVQTSISERGRTPSTDFDRELPVAFTFVYDRYGSRTPTKLIMSSVNTGVRKL